MEQCILTAVLTILSFTTTGVSPLRCYKCIGSPVTEVRDTETRLSCRGFNYSAKFIVNCPFSTMCMKQEFQLDMENGMKTKGERRDCAPQKNDYQAYDNGRWFPTYEIKDPYDEGCQNIDGEGQKITQNRHCYCRTDLCNSSPNTSHEGYTDIMGVIVVFNLMKYINSLR